MEKFAQKKPTCIAYDEKLQFYSNLVIEVRRSPLFRCSMNVRLKLVMDFFNNYTINIINK